MMQWLLLLGVVGNIITNIERNKILRKQLERTNSHRLRMDAAGNYYYGNE